jgi:hypothetical protein
VEPPLLQVQERSVLRSFELQLSLESLSRRSLATYTGKIRLTVLKVKNTYIGGNLELLKQGMIRSF